jgi:nucleoside 2-deoxyribosyltransferase
LNCFVIMPFSQDFDDVYEMIKNKVNSAVSPHGGVCFRLDEARPAGRITDRLSREIQAASICIADVTGNTPNVMWEVGYAMALKKPIIILTQNLNELPFDIRDLQSLEYRRNQLANTLRPLTDMVIDTIRTLGTSMTAEQSDPSKERDELVGILMNEVNSLKDMLSNAALYWNSPHDRKANEPVHSLNALEGTWIDRESGSHFHAQNVNGELIVPYCYGGDYELTGVVFGWKRIGEYWFAKFRWFHRDYSGFGFFKQETLNLISGAWWFGQQVNSIPNAPTLQKGVNVRWERDSLAVFPPWAFHFFEEASRRDLADLIQ